MCLLPRSDELEGQGHQEQKRHFWPFWRLACNLCSVKTSLASSLITTFDDVQVNRLLLAIDVHRCEFCGGED